MKIVEEHKDIRDGAQLSYNVRGFTGTRIMLVTLEDSDVHNAHDRLRLAIQGVIAEYPIGSYYPGTRVPLDQVQAFPAGQSSAPIRVQLNYQMPQFGTSLPGESSEGRLEIGGTVQMQQTQHFIEEIPFTAQEQATLFNTDKQITTTHNKDVQGAEVEYPQVMRIARYSRLEPRSSALNHADLLGTINNAEWRNTPKHSVLCTQALGTSEDGETFEMHYEFQHNPRKWYSVVAYVDPETGDIPPGLTPNKGIRRFRVIPDANFGLFDR